MTAKRILVIEDDKDIVELVRYNLEKDGFQVLTSGDGSMGLAQVRKTPPDLLVLDLMLPKLSGLEICKEIRRDASLNRLPILMLTARGEESDRIVGLELGADDYVTKPFSPRELVARVKALLRRVEPAEAPEKLVEVGALRIDPAAYRVTRAVLPGSPAQQGIFAGPVAGRGMGNGTVRNAAQRGRVRPAVARKDRNGPTAPRVREDNPRGGLPVRNPCKLRFSGSWG
jgi:DNA-binding response OmpR family regulator